jgi:hypothetical protein
VNNLREFYWFLRWWMADAFLKGDGPNGVFVYYDSSKHRAPKSRKPYTGAALPPWIIGWGYWINRRKALQKAQQEYDKAWRRDR